MKKSAKFWMYKGINYSRKMQLIRPKNKFSKEEDEKLRLLVHTLGDQDWELIASQMPGRNVRQVKERYLNYLNPGLNTEPFSYEEDQLLRQKYDDLGNKWVKMTQFFNGRTDIALKNRWMVIQRREKLGLPLYPPIKEKKIERNLDQMPQLFIASYYHPPPYYPPQQINTQEINNQIAPVSAPQPFQQKVNDFYKVKEDDEVDMWGEVMNNAFDTSTDFFSW